MVSEYDWESDTWAHPNAEDATSAAWREAVMEIAAKAKATLPDCTGHVEAAVKMVLAGAVEPLEDGAARVASQSHGQVVYHVVNGACSCKDYPKAPSHWCKHRIAAGLYKRAAALVQRQLAEHANGASNGQLAPSPTLTPAYAEPDTIVEPAQGVPAQHVVLIQGKPFIKFAGLLQMAHARGLVTLVAHRTYNDGELSLAHAVATFQDGRRFEESGDATPANTTRTVAGHFRRVALTRAKARVLRDALGVDLVAVEELAEE
jgi:hypothetical protein